MDTVITANGLKLWVQDSGPQPEQKGVVLLLHGFPDTSDMWQPQIKALTAAGYRTIAPDLPGLGQSDKPTDVAMYSFQTVVTPALAAVLDTLSINKVTVVGHDFGAGLAWGFAFAYPDRVERLMLLSVGFIGTYFTAQPLRQREVSWYIPFFIMPGSEEALMANDWALFKLWAGQNASKEQLDEYIDRLSQPGALTAGLNLYRGNFSAQSFAVTTPIHPPHQLTMPVLAVHSDKDAYCLEGQMLDSKVAVADGCWRHEVLPGVGHWMMVEAPDTVTQLLLGFLKGSNA